MNVPPSTPPGSTIYVTGDTSALCSWQPNCLPLHPIQDSTYGGVVDLPDDAQSATFKVTRGGWDTEASDGLGNALDNLTINLSSPSTETIVEVANWLDLGALSMTGNLQVIQNFASPQLGNSRSIEVWLPPGYDASANHSYPVIYMHDGQNVFNPLTSNSGVAWGMDSTMTALISQRKVPPAIVVGVDCIPDDRLEEYNYALKGALYSDFLISTVKPFIDANYKTLSDRNHTFTMGSSMGAAISLALLWHHSDVFSEAAGLSLPASYPNYDVYQTVAEPQAPLQPVKLYLDDGTAGLDANFFQADAAFDQYLLNLGFNSSDFTYQVFQYAAHSEVDWARRLAVPTQWLFSSADSVGK